MPQRRMRTSSQNREKRGSSRDDPQTPERWKAKILYARHQFQVDPKAPRWCRICGSDASVHPTQGQTDNTAS